MPFYYPSFNKHLSFSKRDKSKLIRNRVGTESVDGSGNFKITKFFEVKTGKCSKFSTLVVKTQSSIEFSNSIFFHNILRQIFSCKSYKTFYSRTCKVNCQRAHCTTNAQKPWSTMPQASPLK